MAVHCASCCFFTARSAVCASCFVSVTLHFLIPKHGLFVDATSIVCPVGKRMWSPGVPKSAVERTHMLLCIALLYICGASQCSRVCNLVSHSPSYTVTNGGPQARMQREPNKAPCSGEASSQQHCLSNVAHMLTCKCSFRHDQPAG